MKTKVLGIIVAILMGLIVGLMFNATKKTVVLTQHLTRNQAETVDLLRIIAQDNQALKNSLTDMGSKINKMDAFFQKLPNPSQKPQAPKEDLNTVYTIPQGEAAVKGNDNAPITIVGFLDLQCPFSKRFQPVIDQVLKAYPKKVKYVVKHFPLGFHKEAIPAAKAVLAAGEQGKFYEMMGLVLRDNNQLSEGKYLELAEEAGLNLKKLKKSLADNDEAWTKLIQDDFALGQKVGVRGTPTFYLDGKKTRARSLEAFKAEIDEILEK